MDPEQNLPSVSESVSSEPVKRKLSSDRNSSTKKAKVTEPIRPKGFPSDSSQEKKGKKVKPANKEVSKPPPPTWFLSIQISNPDSHHALRQAQETILGAHPVFLATMVAVSKAHLTLFLFNPDQDGVTDARLNELCQSISSGLDDWRQNNCNREPISVELDQISHFRNQVIFVQPHWSNEAFPNLWQTLASRLLQDGFISPTDAELDRFKPHVTICKMSKVKKRKQLKKLPRSFPTSDVIDKIGKIDFGKQLVTSLQLLSMTKPPVTDAVTKASYYHCHKEFMLLGNGVIPKVPPSSSDDDHEQCCRTPLRFPEPRQESEASSASRGINWPTLPLLLIAGSGLLALTIARHMFRR